MLRSLVRLDGRAALGHGGGFGGFCSSEALPGALPRRQNSPQHPPYGLYPELLSGTAFTLPRVKNRYTWMYRIRPSVVHAGQNGISFQPWEHPTWVSPPFTHPNPPVQLRFKPSSEPDGAVDFLEGTVTVAANGCPVGGTGVSCNTYIATTSMSSRGRFFRNADADMLILPQEGQLEIKTELGTLLVEPNELALVPRGMAFQVNIANADQKMVRGYFLENFGDPFVIPDLGPIGISSGLAHPRHFYPPDAAYEEAEGEFEIVSKFSGNLWKGPLTYSPLDVVAWYGNYTPYKYDMRHFMAINTATHDHPDPSIGTVLSSYTSSPGLANVDFVIFPPRWLVAENTFRPPWFHRNFMSEFMGLIHGVYDAKPDSFKPGACSVHNRMLPHGPDAAAVQKGGEMDTSKPQKYTGTLAFMWETRLPLHPSPYALATLNDAAYAQGWGNVKSRFDPSNVPPAEEPYPFNPN